MEGLRITVELSSFIFARTLNLPGLFLWYLTLLVFPIMYCSNGIQATQFRPWLLQRLPMSSITSKERGEYGSVAHIKVSIVSLQPAVNKFQYNLCLKMSLFMNNRLQIPWGRCEGIYCAPTLLSSTTKASTVTQINIYGSAICLWWFKSCWESSSFRIASKELWPFG